MAAKNRGGIVADEIIPGGFYQGALPGGFTDSLTGIHVPGPVVKVDDTKRTVVSIESLPDPIQLPHKKRIRDFKDRERKVSEMADVSFDRRDEYPYHEGFNMALATGVIRHIPDEDVKENYPAAWAKRQDNKVFEMSVEVTSVSDLIDKFVGSPEHREQAAEAKKAEQQARQRIEGGAPPPPPPAK